MQKTIESDINITNVVDRVVDVVVVDEVPIIEDVPVKVSESTVVKGVVNPNPIVVHVEQV